MLRKEPCVSKSFLKWGRAFCVVAMIIAGSIGPARSQEEDGLQVAVTLPDLVPVVVMLGGGKLDVVGIMPAGSDIQDFKLPPESTAKAQTADLIVYANSDLFGFEAELKASAGGISSVDWDDYARNGAKLKDFPGHDASSRGFWMGFDNIGSIAGAIAEALMAQGVEAEMVAGNLSAFLGEIDAMEASGKALMKAIGREGSMWAAVVPDVCYSISNLGLKVGDIMVEEAEGFPPGGKLQEMEAKLRSGEYAGLVCPLSMREKTAGETAEQVARAAGSSVCYIRFVDGGEDDSYVAQAAYNAGAFAAAGSNRLQAAGRAGGGSANLIWGLVVFGLLILLAVQNRRMHALATGAALGAGPFQKKGKVKKGKR